MKFSKDFLWGAATSAIQTESYTDKDNKSLTTWETWFNLKPELFFNDNSSYSTNDTYKLYEQDVEAIKKINLNSFRTSISWTRLLPDGKNVNQTAVDYYRNFFSLIKKNNIKLFVNLFHFDMPQWMMDLGGWTNKKIVEKFAFYAKIAFQLFNDLVDYWVTINEPTVHIDCSYLSQHHYPAVSKNWNLAILAGFHTLLAHCAAIKEFRKLNLKSEIGIVLIMAPVYSGSNHPADLIATKNACALFVDAFAYPCVYGKLDPYVVNLIKEKQLSKISITQADLDLISYAKVDFIGANYYQPLRVQRVINENDLYAPIFSFFDFKNKRINPSRNWEIYPQGIYDLAMYIKEKYQNIKWYLSENGMGVANEEQYKVNGIIQDDYRIEFIQEHLHYLFLAIKNGANCFGYHMWTLVDCWSWLNGYKNRYGFYELDLVTKKRTIKKSGIWLKNFIKKGGL